ncbi:hypothetical protein, partial [Pseudomonas graminis]|uniref:hypothetical protein n=1 Tax=Pseudomonas graminis TaxID=158627 RepID=UPI003C238315
VENDRNPTQGNQWKAHHYSGNKKPAEAGWFDGCCSLRNRINSALDHDLPNFSRWFRMIRWNSS